MQILNAMKQATAPNEKTAINEFSEQELMNLRQIISQ